MRYEIMHNVAQTLLYNKQVPSNTSGYLDCEIVGHGRLKSIRIRFAAGENGELHIRPVLIVPPNIPIELLKYAVGGDHYVSGDDENFVSEIGYEVENKAICRIYYDNVCTDLTAADAIVDVQVEVEYFDYVDVENVIGPVGRPVLRGVLR